MNPNILKRGYEQSLRAISVCLVLSFAFFSPMASAAEQDMDREIDYLIEAVAQSKCSFVRNGKAHDADDARDHLQMKRKRGKKYYKNTEQFIDRIASKSSWTGKPYMIDCEGEPSQTAEQWFTTLLAQFRADPEASAEVSGQE